MNKGLLAKSALFLGVLLATIPAAEARGGYRGGYRGGVTVRPYFGGYYSPWGYGYPGYGGYYGGYYGGFGINVHRNQGKLKIDTKQKDAEVYLNGSFAGSAKDMKSTWLKEGTYDLEVRGPGGERYAKQIYVVSGKTIHVRPEMPADHRS